jgi:hypothetical protein
MSADLTVVTLHSLFAEGHRTTTIPNLSTLARPSDHPCRCRLHSIACPRMTGGETSRRPSNDRAPCPVPSTCHWTQTRPGRSSIVLSRQTGKVRYQATRSTERSSPGHIPFADLSPTCCRWTSRGQMLSSLGIGRLASAKRFHRGPWKRAETSSLRELTLTV